MLPQLEKLRELKTVKERQTEHMELLEFQKKEITTTNPVPGEDQDLEQQRVRLKNAAEL